MSPSGPVLVPNTHRPPSPLSSDTPRPDAEADGVNQPWPPPDAAVPPIPPDVERLFADAEPAPPSSVEAGVNVAFVPPVSYKSATSGFAHALPVKPTAAPAHPLPSRPASPSPSATPASGSSTPAPVLAPTLRILAAGPAGKRKRGGDSDDGGGDSDGSEAYDFGPDPVAASSSAPSRPARTGTSTATDAHTSVHAGPVLSTPLPSKRLLKKRSARALLVPVEQLPVYALPPLPPIDDAELLKTVFTHHSLFERARGVFEDAPDRPARHYEKLEHVGDSILGMAVTTWLHETRPGLTCGTATKLKAHLVSNATLSHLSGLYNLPQRLAGDARLLPVLRAQTDVRAALLEAYIAALYFACPAAERLAVALPRIDAWLRDMYEPLCDFFYRYMASEHRQHHAAVAAGTDGVVLTAADAAALAARDAPAAGMALLVQMYGRARGRAVVWDAERFETSVGALWRITCLVDGVEMGDGTRAVRRRAKDVAGWEAAKKLGLAEGAVL